MTNPLSRLFRQPAAVAFAVAVAVAATAGCKPKSPPATESAVAAALVRPFPGGFLSADLKARAEWRARVLASGVLDEGTRASIERGRLTFEHVFQPEEGLGPYFNNTACINCHAIPRAPGRGPIAERAHAIGGGVPDQFGLRPRHTLPGYPEFQLPKGWKDLGLRVPPLLAGLGWIEAIPAEQILAQKHTDHPTPHPTPPPAGGNWEVKGWAQPKPDTGRGSLRFAHKMVVATLDEFIAGAFAMEMGMTVPQNTLDKDADKAPDPEISADRIIDVANFVAFSLPPGQPLPPEGEPGLKLFQGIGCADCHFSKFTVEGKPAPQMYTDLLAHDMGPALAEALADEATPAGHYRTTPLWGLREHPGPYLHDGTAVTLEDAISRHGGEATAARDQWKKLDAKDKAALMAMLHAL